MVVLEASIVYLEVHEEASSEVPDASRLYLEVLRLAVGIWSCRRQAQR